MVRILVVALLALLLFACSSDEGEKAEDLGRDTGAALADPGGEADEGSSGGVADVGQDTSGDGAESTDGSEAEPDLPKGPPDPAFVYKVDSPAVVSAAATYRMDEPTQYRSAEQLADLDVRALSAAGGVWAGAQGGLYRFDEAGNSFIKQVTEGEEPGPVTDIASALDDTGRLAVLHDTFVRLLDPETGDADSVPVAAGTWKAVAAGEKVWLGSEDGPAALQGVSVVMLGGAETGAVRDLAVDSEGILWIASAAGLFRHDGSTTTKALEGDFRAVAPAAPGWVWAGNDKGAVFAGAEVLVREHLAGPDALAYDDVLAIAFAGGRVVLGHKIGASALAVADDGALQRRDYYTGLRWLPGKEVRAVAAESADRYWLATEAGITRVDWVEHSFKEKQEHFDNIQSERYWRMDGFVPSDIAADDAWAPTKWRNWDHDNDGLWTQMQIGAWCYAYAATGEEVFYDRARKAMDVMMLQIDIPATDFEAAGLGRGFVTRSLVREDEGEVFESKKTQSNWHLVSYEGRDYYWKDDTSSDETTGHFFGYPLYYDLCAKTDEEHALVAEHAAALAAYIIDHGYLLIDLDGEKTTHGHWEPERLAAGVDGPGSKCETKLEYCIESFAGGGWLNSIEILGHLLAAWHMTGEQRFYAAYDELIEEHRYDEVATPQDYTATITQPAFMNHSDHELAMLAYHTLIRYEPNDDRRALWQEGLLFLYEHEKGERNPLWAAFVALLVGPEEADVEAPLESLREMPFDRRELYIDNSHRKDAVMWPNGRHGEAQLDRVFPYDEIRTVWWNGNFREAEHGGDGRQESGPMAWLLPYWAFRYAGIISE